MNDSLKTTLAAIVGIVIGAITTYLGLQQAIDKTSNVIHESGKLSGQLISISQSLASAKDKAESLESEVAELQKLVSDLSDSEAVDLARVAGEFKNENVKEKLVEVSNQLASQSQISLQQVTIPSQSFKPYETKLVTIGRPSNVDGLLASTFLSMGGSGYAELIITVAHATDTQIKVYLHNPRGAAWDLGQITATVLNIAQRKS